MNSLPQSPPIAVLVADDHFVVRSGLVTSLELEDDLRVVAQAGNGADAVTAYQLHRPDVVLMDLQLPGLSGEAATEAICANDPNAHVLIFSTFARDDQIQAALDAGALGYLQKTASRPSLLTALRNVAQGQKHLLPELAQRLAAARLGPAITPREREILAHIAAGHANKEIAGALQISEFTVKRHVSRILEKMNVNDRAQAAVEAIRRGLVKLMD